MVKPADTQCRAMVKGKRCKNEISFDQEGDSWTVFCKDHLLADAKARMSGAPRIERADRGQKADSKSKDE